MYNERNNMIVDLDELDKCFNYIKSINSVDLKDIIWKRGDKQIKITSEQCREYEFIGLSNAYFPSIFNIENPAFNSNL